MTGKPGVRAVECRMVCDAQTLIFEKSIDCLGPNVDFLHFLFVSYSSAHMLGYINTVGF